MSQWEAFTNHFDFVNFQQKPKQFIVGLSYCTQRLGCGIVKTNWKFCDKLIVASRENTYKMHTLRHGVNFCRVHRTDIGWLHSVLLPDEIMDSIDLLVVHGNAPMHHLNFTKHQTKKNLLSLNGKLPALSPNNVIRAVSPPKCPILFFTHSRAAT